MTHPKLVGGVLEKFMLDRQEDKLITEGWLSSRLNAVVNRAAKDTRASSALLLLRDQGASVLRIVAWYGQEKAPAGYTEVAGWVLSRALPLCLSVEADVRGVLGSSLDKSLLPVIGAPVVSNGTPTGALIVGCPQGEGKELSQWTPLVETLAELAGALLEKATLQTDLSHKEEQVRDLIRDTVIRDTVEAQEKERERICLEVHDGVAQTLVSAFQYLQTLETTSSEGSPTKQLLLRAGALVRQAIQEAREVINSLQPATLRDLGLVATLRQEMRQLEQEMRWQVDFQAEAIKLPQDVETGLYRIIREAITNVRKHAHSIRLRLWITCADEKVKVEIRDWGVGFNYNPYDISRRQGMGLFSMRKRAELLQGSCSIQSSPGHGTTIYIETPVRKVS